MSESNTESFSFILLKGEALAYPRGTYTPRSNVALVQATDLTLTRDVFKAWFSQSLVPLVGEAAASEMGRLLNEEPKIFETFLQTSLNYRGSQ